MFWSFDGVFLRACIATWALFDVFLFSCVSECKDVIWNSLSRTYFDNWHKFKRVKWHVKSKILLRNPLWGLLLPWLSRHDRIEACLLQNFHFPLLCAIKHGRWLYPSSNIWRTKTNLKAHCLNAYLNKNGSQKNREQTQRLFVADMFYNSAAKRATKHWAI